jgi:hypothetical protein
MEKTEILIGKIYRTKEGNCYDIPDNAPINPLLRTIIKIAIDESEKVNMDRINILGYMAQ